MNPAVADEALQPLRQAILGAARADADCCRRAAEQRAATRLAGALDAAAETVRAARTAGAAEAAALGAGELARRRLEARTIVLSARRERYREVRRRAQRRLRDTGLESALHQRIVAVLGPDARAEPAGDGGLIGIAGDRSVDCSLTALVEHAMSVTAGRIEEVWT